MGVTVVSLFVALFHLLDNVRRGAFERRLSDNTRHGGMPMQDRELYARILGITDPWRVDRVDLKLVSCGNQPANISLIIVEAAKARPGAKGKGEGERKIHLTPVTPYQLDIINNLALVVRNSLILHLPL